MSTTTNKLGLYKPGNGVNGQADEPVDVQRFNDNFDTIDANIGVSTFTSTTRPALPYPNQIIYESDTGSFQRSVGGGVWQMIYQTGLKRKYYADMSADNVDTISLTTFNFGVASVQRRISIVIGGTLGFMSDVGSAGVRIDGTGGVLVRQDATNDELIPISATASWYPYSLIRLLTIPAGVQSTWQIFGVSTRKCFYRITAVCDVALDGEY